MNLNYIVSEIAKIPPAVMNVLNPLLLILMTLVAIATIVVVLMQKSAEANIGAISGSETDTYMGKNKGKSKEVILKRLTIVLGALLLVVSITYFLLQIFQ